LTIPIPVCHRLSDFGFFCFRSLGIFENLDEVIGLVLDGDARSRNGEFLDPYRQVSERQLILPGPELRVDPFIINVLVSDQPLDRNSIDDDIVPLEEFQATVLMAKVVPRCIEEYCDEIGTIKAHQDLPTVTGHAATKIALIGPDGVKVGIIPCHRSRSRPPSNPIYCRIILGSNV
jgi:hypothetical protein